VATQEMVVELYEMEVKERSRKKERWYIIIGGESI
jgi:hypothetical protein